MPGRQRRRSARWFFSRLRPNYPGDEHRNSVIFYPPLTELGPSGNPVLRSVCVMTAQPPPASGHHDGFHRPRAGGYRTLTSEFGGGAGVHPGESDPARMLSGVLVLVVATIILALTLLWWLA